eukprot:6453792-Pyramimonas_sp.AAC.2
MLWGLGTRISRGSLDDSVQLGHCLGCFSKKGRLGGGCRAVGRFLANRRWGKGHPRSFSREI